MHKSFIARNVLKGYKPVDGYPTEHVPTRRAEAQERFAEHLDLVTGNT